jgi:hypothetical protein
MGWAVLPHCHERLEDEWHIRAFCSLYISYTCIISAAGASGLHIGVTAPLRTGLRGKAIESEFPLTRSCYDYNT